MTCTEDGFSAWGKDMGGYSANLKWQRQSKLPISTAPAVMMRTVMLYTRARMTEASYWWSTDGELVLEDPEYCASVIQLRTSEHRSMYSYVRLSIDRCTATYV